VTDFREERIQPTKQEKDKAEDCIKNVEENIKKKHNVSA
jgi:hypothetical protein